MNEKQIDLDAMRALADGLSAFALVRRFADPSDPWTIVPTLSDLVVKFRASLDEIEQLRKEVVRVRETWRADYESAITRSVDYKAAADRLYSEGEALRKERDALREALKTIDAIQASPAALSRADRTLNTIERVARAALAAQGEKPHE